MNNYNEIFDFLHSKGLHGDHMFKIGHSYKPKELFKICKTLLSYINSESEMKNSEFDFLVNSALSGDSMYFADHDLRVQRIENLLSSTLLYADSIYIKNPLDDYYHADEEYFSVEENVEEFLIDIFIFCQYKLALCSGFVKICKTETHFCRHCLLESLDDIPPRYKKSMNQIEQYLTSKYVKGASYTINKKNGQFVVNIKPQENTLFDHSGLEIYYDELPDEFKNGLGRNNKKIYQREIKDSWLIKCDFVDPILDDVIMHDWYANNYKLNYFTDRPVDFELLKILNNTESNLLANKLIKSLQHTFPFIHGATSEKIIELRNNEPEAFLHYRDSMEKLLRNASNLNESDLISAVKDEIRPQVHKIDLVLKKHKSKLGKGLLVNLLLGSASIFIGLKTGILPAPVGNALAALGIANHGGQAVHNLKKVLNREIEVVDETYYFLWKLKK